MIRRVLYGGALIAGISLAFQRGNIDLNSPYFGKFHALMGWLSPKLADGVLRQLIKFRFFAAGAIQRKYGTPTALDHGFDIDGYYLDGLLDLGFDYVLLGPVSYQASWQDVEDPLFPRHLGVKSLKARLVSMSQPKGKRIRQQQVGVSLIPSKDSVTYTPYLVDTELARSARQIATEVDFAVLNFLPQYIGLFEQFTANEKMVEALLTHCHQEMAAACIAQNRPTPKIFVRLEPESSSFSQLVKQLELNPLVDGFVLTKSAQNLVTSKLVLTPQRSLPSQVLLLQHPL